MPNYIKLGNLRIEIPEPAPVDPGDGGNNGGGGGGSSSLLTGLLAFYNLSDLSDASGNNHTLSNSNDVTFSSGKIGNAATLDGSNWLLSETRHNFGSQFTAACWVKIITANSLRPALSQWSGGFGTFYLGTAYGNYVFATCHDEDVYSPTWLTGGTAATNQWVHLAGVYSGSSEKLFVNGAEVASQNVGPIVNPDTGTFKVGTFDGGGEFMFQGQIDAAGIWSRALTSAEITELYNAGTGKEHPFA